MDSSCRSCIESLALLNINPETLRGGKYNYSTCEACYNYYPDEHIKEPPKSVQVNRIVYHHVTERPFEKVLAAKRVKEFRTKGVRQEKYQGIKE